MPKEKSLKVRNSHVIRSKQQKSNGSRSDQVAGYRNGTRGRSESNDSAIQPGGNGKNNGKSKMAEHKSTAARKGYAHLSRRKSDGKTGLLPLTDLERASQRYSNLYDFAPVPYISFDRTGRIEEINLAAAELLGRPRRGLIGLPIAIHVLADDTDLLLSHLLRCRKFEKEVSTELRLKNRRGTVIFAQIISRPVSFSDVQDGGLLFQTAIVDLTERKKNEQRLAEQANLLDLTNDAIIVRDDKDRIVYWNNGAEKLYGYTRDEALGEVSHHFLKTKHPEPLAKIVARLRSARRWEGELVHYHKDGTELSTFSRWTLAEDATGRQTVLESNTDITERKRVALTLRQREEFLRRLVDTAPMCISVVASDGRLLQINSAGTRMLDATSAAQLEGKCIYGLIAPEYRQEFREFNEHICRGTKGSLQFEVVSLKGTRRGMETHAAPIRWFDGERVQLAITNDITERKRAEQVLLDSERRFREIIDALPAAVYTTDAQGRITHFNQHCVELSGRVPELKSDRWCVTWKLYYPDGRPMPHDECPMAIALKTGRVIRGVEAIAERPDGTRVWFTPYPTPLRDYNGRLLGAINMLVDITDRKKAEALLAEGMRQREALLQFVQRRGVAQTIEEIYSVGLDTILQILRCDRASILLFDDKKTMRFVGWRGLSERYRKAVEGHSAWKPSDKNPQPICIEDIERSDLSPELQRTIKREGIRAAAFIPLRAESRLIGKFMMYYDAPHQFTDVEMNISLNIAAQLGLGIERKRAENALRTSEERNRSIIQQSIAGIAETDLTGRFQVVNDRYCQITGYSRDQLLRLRMQDITHHDDLPENQKRFKECARHGRSFEIEKRYIRKDGSEVVVHNSVSAIRDQRNRVHGIVAVCIDITDRIKAEEALRESEEQMRATVEQAVAGVARSDRDGRIVFANKRFCELVGYRESELIGRNASQFTHAADMEKTAKNFRHLVKHGKSFDLEKRYIRKDGSVIWVNVSASPIRDAKGRAHSAVAVVVDISDRKMAETQLRRSKEMLEELVQQRTQALREANEELENEINRRRGLEDQILQISDREQQRLAQELHDGLCQELTAIGFMARATALRVKNHRVLEPQDMEQIATLVNQAANNARNISRALHRVDVDAAGFGEALQSLATKETWKIPCRVAVKKGFQITDNRTAIHLYGIAREAVMNANKYAQAREVVIQLSKAKDTNEIVLTVADDGIGLAAAPKHSPGMGFHIMDYRARSIGGRLEVESRKDAGTRISCYVPAEK